MSPGYPEPRRVAPRLAVYVRDVPEAVSVRGSARVRSVPVQLRACARRVRQLGGVHDGLDVFVDVAASDAQWSVLMAAVVEGLYDGVVVDSLRVVVTGDAQASSLRRLLGRSACELYVVADCGLAVSGAGGVVFAVAVLGLWGAGGCEGASGLGATPAASSAGVIAHGVAVDDSAVLLARLSRIVELFLDAGDDPRRLAVLRCRRLRVEAELRRVRLLILRGWVL